MIAFLQEKVKGILRNYGKPGMIEIDFYRRGGKNVKIRRLWQSGIMLLCVMLAGCSPAAESGSPLAEVSSQMMPPSSPATEDVSSAAGEEQNPLQKRAEEIVAGMTLEQKVGQLFLARCPTQNAAEDAAAYHLGGYILFARDFEGKTPDTALASIQSYQAAAEIPLLIAVDEEGGTVNRVSRYTAFRETPFSSPQTLFKQGGYGRIREDTAEKAALLKSLGINVNMAPVCDVSQNPADFIYARSFGKDGEQTAQYVKTVVTEMEQDKLGSVLKHFPGYGNSADTHTGIARDSRSYETFEEEDFLPFRAGIAAGADAVLVAHTIVECMDAKRPASLSPKVHRVLREELGFEGVIITDDLAMEGIRDFAGDESAAVMAVQAGNDLICCTDYRVQLPAVLDAVQKGEIPLEQVEESAARVISWKLSLGILT